VLAHLVVDAATIGVPLDEWREFPSWKRALIVREHNNRVTRK
jgi:hypothetical protein